MRRARPSRACSYHDVTNPVNGVDVVQSAKAGRAGACAGPGHVVETGHVVVVKRIVPAHALR